MLLWLVFGKQPLRRRKGASGRQSASVGASSSPRSRFASCPVWHTWSLVGERLVHIAKGPSAAASQRGQFPGSARVDISTAVLCAGARDLRRASGRKRVLPWIPPKSTDSLSAKLSANQRTLWQTSATLHTLQTPHSSPFPNSGSALTRKGSLVQIHVAHQHHPWSDGPCDSLDACAASMSQALLDGDRTMHPWPSLHGSTPAEAPCDRSSQ